MPVPSNALHHILAPMVYACRMAASGNDHQAAYTFDQLVINLVPDFYITKDKLEPQST
jgi:hypothetical protein